MKESLCPAPGMLESFHELLLDDGGSDLSSTIYANFLIVE